MDTKKVNVLAAVAAMMQLGEKAPPKEKVQELKARPRVSLSDALTHLMAEDVDLKEHVDQGEKFQRKLKKMTDKQVNDAWPNIASLWNGDHAPVIHTGGTQGASIAIKLEEVKTVAAMLATYNLLCKKRGMPIMKSWKGSRKMLEDRVNKLKKAIEQDIPPFRVYPPAVANGAYKDDEEALRKTGHTTRGKPAHQEKKEKRAAKWVEKQVGKTTEPKATSSKPREATPKGDHLTLADVARSINMLPKVARAKARKHAKELKKLEVGGKYKYAHASKAKVAAILQADNRKK
jgi:hypothetical protein